MKREEIDIALDVMQAYRDGRTVEFRKKNSEQWTPADSGTEFDFSRFEYRTRPEIVSSHPFPSVSPKFKKGDEVRFRPSVKDASNHTREVYFIRDRKYDYEVDNWNYSLECHPKCTDRKGVFSWYSEDKLIQKDEITDEMLSVIDAYVNGKNIQYRSKGSTEWHMARPSFKFDMFEYRVEPEISYRPFESVQEITRAIKKHGNYVKKKGCCRCYAIVDFDFHNDYVTVYSELPCSFDYMFNNYVFSDEAPCGVCTEEEPWIRINNNSYISRGYTSHDRREHFNLVGKEALIISEPFDETINEIGIKPYTAKRMRVLVDGTVYTISADGHIRIKKSSCSE